MNELDFAWRLTVYGMGTVFLALSLVAGLVSLFRFLEKPRTPGTAPVAEEGIPPEVVAVLGAALAVALQKKVRVHRVRYRKGAPEQTWSRQGRISIMASHRVR